MTLGGVHSSHQFADETFRRASVSARKRTTVTVNCGKIGVVYSHQVSLSTMSNVATVWWIVTEGVQTVLDGPPRLLHFIVFCLLEMFLNVLLLYSLSPLETGL